MIGNERTRRAVIYWLLLLPLVVLGVFPYLVMLFTALKSPPDLFAYPPRLLPSKLDFTSIVAIWDKADFARAIFNGMVVSLSTTALTLVFAIPAAYSLARFQVRGSSAIRVFLMITQMISPVVLIIGIFRLMAAMGMMNDLKALILALTGFSVAFAVWMLQSYFKTIPPEMEEAAAIDGASWFATLRLIFLPLAAPAIGVAAVFTFITAWTDFVLSYTLLRSPEMATATLKVVYLVSGQYTVAWNEVMAAAIVTTLPIIGIFIVFQRQIVGGLVQGAVK